MKRKNIVAFLLVVICLFCVTNIYADSNKEVLAKKEVIPAWVNGLGERGLWLGVSPPIANKEQARCFAITNAVLSYLYAEGGAEITNIVKTRNREMDKEHYYSFLEDANVGLFNIGIDVVNEYYNKRNEYIVACQIKKDTESSSTLTLKKSVLYLQGETKCIVSVLLRSEPFNFKILYDSEEGLKYALNGEEKSVDCLNKSRYRYPSRSLLNIDKNVDDVYIEKNKGNIGLSQFIRFCYLPLVADSIDVQSVTELKNENSLVIVDNTTNYIGVGKSVPLKMYLSEIKGTDMKYKLPKVKINECDVSEDVQVGLLSKLVTPFLTSMQVAFYESIHVMASLDGSKFKLKESVSEDRVLSKSVSSAKIDNFEIDWCIGKESLKNSENTPYVIVRRKNNNLAD